MKKFISKEHFKEILDNDEYLEWYDCLDFHLPRFNIDNMDSIVAFLAQTIHESNNYHTLTEDLRYTSSGLMKIFPKYFTPQTSKYYAGKPIQIANKVYSNRMGNGDEASGDGWKYRGGGIIQLTFKDNYQQFSNDCNLLLEDAPSYVRSKNGAVESACWYWDKNDLNKYVKNFKTLTKKINGGTIGLPSRIAHYNSIVDIVSIS